LLRLGVSVSSVVNQPLLRNNVSTVEGSHHAEACIGFCFFPGRFQFSLQRKPVPTRTFSHST
jgi:hypothetical protein